MVVKSPRCTSAIGYCCKDERLGILYQKKQLPRKSGLDSGGIQHIRVIGVQKSYNQNHQNQTIATHSHQGLDVCGVQKSPIIKIRLESHIHTMCWMCMMCKKVL